MNLLFFLMEIEYGDTMFLMWRGNFEISVVNENYLQFRWFKIGA